MDFNEFIKIVKEYNPRADSELIRKAFEFANEAHKDQKRQSGEEYIMHPLGVAEILSKLRADTATICAALLHDVVEDTSIKLEEIQKEFGEEIADLVQGVTKFKKIEFDKKEEYKAENFRKILLASAKDIRVMLIKLADRLHNMRTLKFFRPEKQKRIAEETMHIYAPIAHKLGIGYIKGELEDLSLRYLEPKVYQYLKARISEKRKEREQKTEDIIEQIRNLLKKNEIPAIVTGRAKYFYSIYQKMKKDNKTFEDIFDLIAVRIITDTIPNCYKAFELIHKEWKPDENRFKDFIKNPKPNGYQSLHTTVFGPYNKMIEIQVRSKEMHDFAEEGIAAHWKYKGTERDKKFEQKISWIKQLLEWKRTNKDAQDIIEDLSIDLYANEIIVFTPKGDPISLPEEATPVDFAFEVHTKLGTQCSKAKANGNIVPLDHKLESGDIVEIITQKNAKVNRQWLNFVKSSMAKSKIRQELNMPLEKSKKEFGGEEERQLILADQIEAIGRKGTVKISKCCYPKPGDKIIGFLTKDKKITVHKNTCVNVKNLNDIKKVELKWKKLENKYERHLVIVSHDRPGLIKKVLNILSKAKIIIKAINTRASRGHIVLEIKVHAIDNEILTEVIKIIRKYSETLDVRIEK